MRNKVTTIVEALSTTYQGELLPGRRIYEFIDTATSAVQYAEGPDCWLFNIENRSLKNEYLYAARLARSHGAIDGKLPYLTGYCCGGPIDRTSVPMVPISCWPDVTVPYSVNCTLKWGYNFATPPSPSLSVVLVAEPNPLTFKLYMYPYYLDFWPDGTITPAYYGRTTYTVKGYVYGNLYTTFEWTLSVTMYCCVEPRTFTTFVNLGTPGSIMAGAYSLDASYCYELGQGERTVPDYPTNPSIISTFVNAYTIG
jgi:hypothetical protein